MLMTLPPFLVMNFKRSTSDLYFTFVRDQRYGGQFLQLRLSIGLLRHMNKAIQASIVTMTSCHKIKLEILLDVKIFKTSLDENF